MLTAANRPPFESAQPDVFDTLDDYSLLHILELLNLSDLVTVASFSPRIAQLAVDYTLMPAHNFRNATLRIELSGHHLLTKVLYLPAGKERKLTDLFTGHDLVLATLKVLCPLFGSLFIMLDYYHPLNSTQTQQAVSYANRYCATIPQHVHIINGKGSMTEFTALNVSGVSINYPEKFANFSLAERFPRLQKLSIRIDRLFAINERLPHLQHFELLDTACGRFDLRAFAEFNPRMCSVKLDLCEGLDRLQEVNAMFPELESLHYVPRAVGAGVERVQPRAQPTVSDRVRHSVRFRKVTSYTVDLTSDVGRTFPAASFARLLSIQFDRLESLTFVPSANIYSNGLLDLVDQYKELIHLDCSALGLLYEEIWRVIELLPNLQTIDIRPKKDRTHAEDILPLMGQTNLGRIHVWIDDMSMHNYREINLPEQWTLHVAEQKSTYSTGVAFERNSAN